MDKMKDRTYRMTEDAGRYTVQMWDAKYAEWLSLDTFDSSTRAEHYIGAAKDATLGVGHVWTEVGCPAYRTYDPADCTCRK